MIKTNYPSKDEVEKIFKLNDNGEVVYLDNTPIKCFLDANGYHTIRMKSKKYKKLHQIVWVLHNGDIPADLTIDHINRVRTDNRIENLRLATASLQCRNRCSFKGGIRFIPDLSKYAVRVTVEGVRIYLGFYENKDEAERDINKCYDLIDEGYTLQEIKDIFNITETRAEHQSQFKCVNWDKVHKKWRIGININKKMVSFGDYADIDEAIDRSILILKMLKEGFGVSYIKRILNIKVLGEPTCSVRGIDFKKDRYVVRKTINGKRLYVGAFKTLDEAVKALENARKEEKCLI